MRLAQQFRNRHAADGLLALLAYGLVAPRNVGVFVDFQ
jgi:hypothetical protein